MLGKMGNSWEKKSRSDVGNFCQNGGISRWKKGIPYSMEVGADSVLVGDTCYTVIISKDKSVHRPAAPNT